MRTLLSKLVILGLPISVVVPACAGSLEDGIAAYKRGDYVVAREHLGPRAEQGDAQAQVYLGLMYENGQGVPHNEVEAVKWYRKAAEQGDASAQYNLGLTYRSGRGVRQNDREAANWYLKSAEQGDAQSEVYLALMYKNGYGVPQSDPEAVKWYCKAAEQGDASGQYNLGAMYATGRGVPQDETEAMRWYRKSAEQGYVPAQSKLGLMYAAGRGAPQDFVLAHMGFDLAIYRSPAWPSEVRDSNVNLRDQVTIKMSPAEIAESQRLTREWQPK
jgi:uncharacterized protein